MYFVLTTVPEWSKGAHLRCAVAMRRVGSNPTGGNGLEGKYCGNTIYVVKPHNSVG